MSKLNVLLVDGDCNNVSLKQKLEASGFTVASSQYTPQLLALVKEINPDVIMFKLDSPSESLLADLHYLHQHLPSPIIMLADDSNPGTIKRVINAEVSTYTTTHYEHLDLGSIIHTAIARFKHQQALNNELETIRAQLENRKQIDRAKAILIKTQRFTEDEAYHTLRKLAMDRNITLAEMAKNVIAMAELLK